MAEANYLQLKPNFTALNLIKAIEKNYLIKKIESQKSTFTYLDTFDWRLYRNNLVLKYEDNLLQLENFDSKINTQDSELNHRPVFIDDLPECNIKDNIKKVIQVRALQPVGNIVVSRDQYNVLDGNEKIVMRLQIDSINRVGKFITIRALRGYSNQIEIVKSLIKSLTEDSNQKTRFEKIIKLNGKIAADYDPRI